MSQPPTPQDGAHWSLTVPAIIAAVGVTAAFAPWPVGVALAGIAVTSLGLLGTRRPGPRSRFPGASRSRVKTGGTTPGALQQTPGDRFESALVARIEADPEGRITRVNGLAATLLGVSAEALLGAPFDAYLPGLREATRGALSPTTSSERRRWTLRGARGVGVPIDLSLRTAPDGAAFVELIDVSVDAGALTAARQGLRDALTERASKERLLRAFGQTVRWRATEVANLGALLAEETTSPDLGAALAHASVENDGLIAVTDDILDLTCVGGVARDDVLDPLALVEAVVVDQVATLGAPAAGWIVAVAPGLERALIGDVAGIRRAMTNLLVHATTVSSPDHLHLRVSTATTERGRVALTLSITDGGPPRRFADGSWSTGAPHGSPTSGHGGNAGLEMTIARAFASRLGADIAVEEVTGRGPTLSLTVPMVPLALVDDPRTDSLDGVEVFVALASADEARAVADLLMDRGAKVSLAQDRGPTTAPDRCDVIVADNGFVSRGALRGRPAMVVIGQGDGTEGGDAWLPRPLLPSALVAVVARLGVAAADRRSAPGSAPDQRPSAREPVSPPRNGRVLLVDDDVVNQRVAARMLEDLGFRVTVVGDGHRALEAARGGGFDVVLMDWHLPGLDGLEVTRRLRADPGPGASVPIIALTGRAMAADIDTCLAAGMNGHVAKPLGRRPLAAALVAYARPLATAPALQRRAGARGKSHTVG